MLNAEKYERYQDLRRFAVETAVREINEVTDITVSYTPIKTGRRLSGMQFIFRHKQISERLEAEATTKNKLQTGK